MGGPITVMGTGESVKDLVDITTVLDAIGDCILQPPSSSQILLVGSGQPTTVGELAISLADLTGIDIVHIDADPNDLSGYVNCESAPVDLQSMIENIWRAVKIETGVA